MIRTLPHLFETSVAKFGPNPFLWEKTGESYQKSSYREVREKVHQFAAGLLAIGVQPGHRLALMAEGRNYWIIAELGILFAGGINVPLSIKLDAESEVKFRLQHSEAGFIIVSGNQLPKIKAIRNSLPLIKTIILLDPLESYAADEIFVEDLMEKGRDFLLNFPLRLDETWKAVGENHFANICYTSGTTADPKGILLTHLNYYTNVEQSITLMDIPSYFKTLCILPLDHSFAAAA